MKVSIKFFQVFLSSLISLGFISGLIFFASIEVYSKSNSIEVYRELTESTSRFSFDFFNQYNSNSFLTTQPPGVVLNPNGTSTTGGVFNTSGWVVTRGPGVQTHAGDDYYADDLARSCGQTAGQNLYAGISGIIDLNPLGNGQNDYYGNTIVIYDETSHFALRYAHMQEFNPALQNGMQVCAGQYLGKVGNTGNVTGSCPVSPGAHLHLVLYKNVQSLTGRPIRGVLDLSGGPTTYSAPFTYNASQVINQSGCSSASCYNGTSTLRNNVDGGPPIHPPGSILKASTDTKNYLIDSEGRKRWITTPSLLANLYDQPNSDFSNWTITVGQDELNLYETGANITLRLNGNGKSFPDGKIIRRSSGGEISIVSGGGKQRGFFDYNRLQQLGFDTCNIVTIPDADYDSYKPGGQSGPPVEAMPLLTASLRLYDISYVGQPIRGEFTIRNVGYNSVSLDKLLIGGRLNGSTNADFPFVSGVTLSPGQSYTYSKFYTPTSAGTYVFYVSYQELNGHWTIAVPANNGIIRTETVTINNAPPQQITVSVGTNPAGGSFIVDGTTYTANRSFSWNSGSSHTIGTTSPQIDGNTRYNFTNWNDGNTQISRTVSPTANTTYTANFTTQHYLTMNAGTGGTVSPQSNWYNAGQQFTINATPNSGYNFSSWAGSGNGSYSGANNPATVTMNSPITQSANFTQTTCNYTLNPTQSPQIPAGGGNGFTFTVTTTSQICAWTPTTNANWITITSGNGPGNGTVTYNVAANGGTTSRSGQITVGGQVHTVNQDGSVSCNYEIAPMSRDFQAIGGNGDFTVTAPAGCTWTVTAQSSFSDSLTQLWQPQAGLFSSNPWLSNSDVLFKNLSVLADRPTNTFTPDSPLVAFNANAATLGPIPDSTGSGCQMPGSPRDVAFSVSGLTNNISTVSALMTFNPAHTYAGDIVARLIAPNGAAMDVFGYTGATTATGGGNGSDLAGAYIFSDSASGTNWWTAAGTATDTQPIPAGTYRTTQRGGAGVTNPAPVTSLNAIFGGLTPTQANGTWILRFTDGCAADTGSVSAASLDIATSGTPTGWITPQPPTSGSGNGTVNYTVAQNSGQSSRTGTITLTGSNGQTKVHTVNQTGTTPSIQVTVQTNPAGRSFIVDGVTYTSPQTFNNWTPGSPHTIATTSPQSGGTGTQYVWSSWSDGNPISHTVSPTTSTTYTANFTTQHFLTMIAGTGGTVSPSSGWFNTGQQVQINATPNGGYLFNNWTGNYSGANNPATITVNTPMTQTGNFTSVPLGRVKFDFDGDGKADISVFRPSNGAWYLNQSTNGFTGLTFGFGTDALAPADFDGDGKTDVAVFRDGFWYYLKSSNGAFVGVQFGQAGDLPRPGDFDGDGKADINVFRPSNGAWYRLNSSDNSFFGTLFGQNGDQPVLADFDGDGKSDIVVFRPSGGVFYWLESTSGQFKATQFGVSTDVPTPGDFDGDGKTDIAVFRPSNGAWYRYNSTDGSFFGIAFGQNGDIPVTADYDGDGKADIAVFRPSNGAWYRLDSSNGGFVGQVFGYGTDTPIPAAFNR